MESAVSHVKEKDTPSLPTYYRGGIIVYETVFNLLTRFHLKLDEQLVHQLNFDSLDFIAFAPQPASIDNGSSLELFPVVFYVKRGPLATLFQQLFGKKHKVMVV